MRWLIGGILVVIVIGIGVSFVKMNKVEPEVRAKVTTPFPTSASTWGNGKAFECWNGMKLVFKLEKDDYKMYIFNPSNPLGHKLNQSFWETEVGNVTWNPGCSKVAFTQGSPSAGEYVSFIDAKKLTEVSVDLFEEFTEETEHGSRQYTYGHMYTSFERWENDDEAVVRVAGQRDGEVEQPPALYFLVDARTGKVIKRIL